MPTQILLVDDHAIVRKGLQALLENNDDLTVIGEAEDGKSAVALSRELLPDVVIMDISMKGLNGIEATKQICKYCPETKIIALSIHSEKHFVEDMLQAGAAGYILKESIPEDLILGIRAVMSGDGYLSPSIVGIVVSRYHEGVFQAQKPVKISDTLLLTKLHKPEISVNHLHRPGLLQRLDDKRHLMLQNIIAPAGYGKTTLVNCWLSHTDWPFAWYSLDETDNELRQFLLYFTHALQSLFPDSLSKTSEFLSSPDLPPNPVLVSYLVNEIQEIKQNFIFVLDDFHLITNLSVHDLLSSVLRYPPDNIHLIIVARRDSFLPVNTFRAQEKVNEIRLNDLKFSESETREFLQSATKTEVDATTSSYWTQRTEGWITALHLAVLSMSHKSNITTLSDKTRIDANYIMEYFNSEVIVHQQPITQKLLMCTSILNRFCAPLCEAVFLCDEDSEQKKINGKDFIDTLKQNNLFLIAFDGDNFWFRYHHLFQELLQKSLAKEYSTDYISRLHSHASKWFEENNLIEEAIQHAVKSNDIFSATNLIERNRRDEHEKMWWTIEKWLTYIPEPIKKQSPGILLAYAWILHDHFQLKEMSIIIKRIESEFNDKLPDNTALGELRLFQGILKYWQGKGEESIKLLQEAEHCIQKKYLRMHRIIENYKAVANQMTGHGKAALQDLNTRLSSNEFKNKANTIQLYLSKSFIEMLSGDHVMSADDAHNLGLVPNASVEPMPAGWINYLQAVSLFRSNKLEEALPYFMSLVEQRYSMITRASIDAMIGLALTYQAMNRPDSCQETVKQLKDFSRELNDRQYIKLTQSAIARLALAQNNLSIAKHWLQSFDDQTPLATMFVWLENPCITKARVLLAIGSDDSLQYACKLLESTKSELESLHNTCQQFEIIPLLALNYYKQNRIDRVLDVLKEMINLTNSNNWIQPFVELGTPMKNMLIQILEKTETLSKIETDFIKNIVASFASKEHMMQAEQSSLITEQIPSLKFQIHGSYLTTREIEILILLKQRLSNKEIAEKLFISLETVKSHMKKIFTKFEVGHRKEAVKKANELGFYDIH